jgi:acetyltransferase-like isoleucine patch superfamily enzyme
MIQPPTIHPSAIVDDGAQIGTGTRVWHWVHVCGGAVIGEGCSLGQNVFVANRVRIGDNVKIQNNVSVYDNVTLEDDVFCGPSMVFTNVYNPRSAVSRKDQYMDTLVRQGATLGANCTIICGITIGRHSFVGAGAMVNRDVPDHALVVGVPAKQIGWMSAFGEQLSLPLEGSGGGDLRAHRRPLRAGRYDGHSNLHPGGHHLMQFIDLAAQQDRIRSRLEPRLQAVLSHGRYIMGPEVTELEERLADFVGVSHCISCGNGTDALQIAQMALGVGKATRSSRLPSASSPRPRPSRSWGPGRSSWTSTR